MPQSRMQYCQMPQSRMPQSRMQQSRMRYCLMKHCRMPQSRRQHRRARPRQEIRRPVSGGRVARCQARRACPPPWPSPDPSRSRPHARRLREARELPCPPTSLRGCRGEARSSPTGHRTSATAAVSGVGGSPRSQRSCASEHLSPAPDQTARPIVTLPEVSSGHFMTQRDQTLADMHYALAPPDPRKCMRRVRTYLPEVNNVPPVHSGPRARQSAVQLTQRRPAPAQAPPGKGSPATFPFFRARKSRNSGVQLHVPREISSSAADRPAGPSRAGATARHARPLWAGATGGRYERRLRAEA